jgi:EAL domain-containing protein (putative c-di-GMP-specific phosphodiesterase class I)
MPQSTQKCFPIARLKIDPSFVRDIPEDEEDKAIVKATISLGHELNLKVIAEGVETEQQLEFLRSGGCDEMQGYFFSRPVSPMELVAVKLRGVSDMNSQAWTFGTGNRSIESRPAACQIRSR